MSKSFDVVVIGAGTGGYVAAIRASQLGKTVAVVEKQSALGGTCLIWGCIPTKALLEHAHALKVIQQASEWGVTIPSGTPTINMTQVHARKDKIVGGLTKGIEFLFKKHKITWVKGTARLAGPGRLKSSMVTNRRSRRRRSSSPPARHRAAFPPSPSITRASSRATRPSISRTCPQSLVILGSGAVGVEFASIYRRFGSEVTLIELVQRLVPVEDEAVSAELEKSFKKQGITVLTGTKVTKATSSASGVSIEAETLDGKTKKIAADMLLVATGRGPVTTGLGAEEAGVAMERGYIKVDDLYRTSMPGISAIGDVITLGTGVHPQLAHVSSMEGVITAERIAGKHVQPLNYDHVPGCTYCDPEIGSVGLTEAQAKERGYDVRIGTFPFGVLGRARMAGESEGFVKIVADKKYR